MRFLVTRPRPDCKRTADKLRAAGHVADEAPLLRFQAVPPERFDLSGVSSLAFSSRRAVAVLAGHPQFPDLKALPVFTVGEATAAACRQAGFQDVHTAEGDVRSLGRLILASQDQLKPGAVFHPAARERAGDLEGFLARENVSCRTEVVYGMDPASDLPAGVAEALQDGAYDGVLIYSRRTAEVLVQLLTGSGLDHILPGLYVYAISRQAAGPLSDVARVHVADEPCEKSLLDLVLAEC